MLLQDRDIQILAFLMRYKYLETGQIKHRFFPEQTKSNMHRVLKRLVDLGLIEKRVFPKTTNLKMGYLVHLTDKGAKALAREWDVPLETLPYKRITSPISSINRFYHRKLMVDFWIKLDDELENHPLELKYFATDTEYIVRDGKRVLKTHIETHDGKTVLVPDMVFTLKNSLNGKEVVFFVEIDTGKETIGGRFKLIKPNTLLDKYKRYKAILKDKKIKDKYENDKQGWHKSVFTTANMFRVLTVTETTQHIQTMQNQAEETQEFNRWSKYFLNSTHEVVQKYQFLTDACWLPLKVNGGWEKLF